MKPHLSCLALVMAMAAAAPAFAQMDSHSNHAPAAVPSDPQPESQIITPPTPSNEHHVFIYPPLSRALGEEGTTILSFVVNADGTVSDARVARSSGSLRLDAIAAEEVTRSWRYHPATKAGTPVATRFEAAVAFSLGKRTDNWTYFPMTEADFPPGAYASGEAGATSFLISTDQNGKVLSGMLWQSSGYADLDAAAKARLFTQQFPAQKGDSKTAFMVYVVFTWPEHGPEHGFAPAASGAAN